jgi:hypothetical protein
VLLVLLVAGAAPLRADDAADFDRVVNYNVLTDTSEKQNLAAKNPGVVTQLKAKIARWHATLTKEYSKAKDND